jgi:hypothetical protein
MDPFSYLSVLLSIILGLGLTQILTAMGRLIRARRRVIPSGPPLVWAGLLLVIYVQVWWSMFGLRERAAWTFLEFFVVLLQTITLYMTAALVLPETAGDEGTDLGEHYERHAPWFFGFVGATVAVSIVKELVIERRLPEPANLAFHIFLLVVCGSAIAIRRPWYHRLVATVSAAGVVLYITILFSQLK